MKKLGAKSRSLEDFYHFIFPFYAILFIATTALHYTSFISLKIMFIIMLCCSLAASLVFLFIGIRWLNRKLRNRQARLSSQNPHIQILEEHTILNYEDPEYIFYTRRLIVRSVTNSATKMRLYIGWPGTEADICVENKTGCEIAFVKCNDAHGYYVDATFVKAIGRKTEYPFDFTLGIDNSKRLIKPFIHKKYPYLAENVMSQTIKIAEKIKGRFAHELLMNPNSHNALHTEYEDDCWVSTFVSVKPDQRRGYRISLQS